MTTPEPAHKNFSTLISDIDTGQVKIPQFQRQFVWSKAASARLIDSMIKGFPIGTFIFWRTDEELRSVRNIGNINLPVQSKGEFVNYVLDGQQRITSIFAAIKGEKIERELLKIEDFSEMYVDLNAREDEDIIITDISNKDNNSVIKLTDLMEGSFKLLASYPEDMQNKIQQYQNVLKGYSFNITNLKNASMDIATEVFTRLNVGGKPLTLFEIMVAKTYDANQKFDLSEKYSELLKELEKANFEIPTATVLQVICMLIKKEAKRSSILRLDKSEFIKMWSEAEHCINQTIDFFRGFGIVVSRLLPYPALIVPFSYFFFKHKKNPTGDMKKRLEDFFWRISLGMRYSSAVESKLVQDVEKIDKILDDSLPKYEWSVDISPENLMKKEIGWFGTGRSIIKAILCLYAIHKPKSFDNNQDVRIDNSWLKVSTSKNYHHFFPKAYMSKSYPEMDYWHYNHILNITIVDDFLNKSRIKAKAPSVYMKTFQKENDDIGRTMKTHLIGNLKNFGILENNYEKFFKARARRVSQEFSKRLIEQTTGFEEQVEEIEESAEYENKTMED